MGLRAPYVDKLIAELDARAEGYGHPTIHTVFIGGGTPSLLQPEQMTRILDALYRNFPLARDAEISCEANPGALTPRFLAALRNGGVNRLSLGAQSADAEQLKLLNRQHSWAQVEQAVRPRTSTDDIASAERSMRMAVFLSIGGRTALP